MKNQILGLKISWSGKGLDEKCYHHYGNKKKLFIQVDKKYFRPLDIDYLRGDFAKARRLLKFKPKYTLLDLAKEMLKSDLEQHQIKIHRYK